MSFVGLLNKTCTFQLNTPTQNSAGQWKASWANVALLTNLRCRIEPIGGGLVSTPSKVYETATHTLFLEKPATPTINTKDHRVVIDGEAYIILLVPELFASSLIHHLEIVLEKTT